jgi:hypothetical protein
MSEQRVRRLEEAQKYAKATVESYKTVWDLFAEAQERQARLTQGFVEGTISDTISNLRTEAKRNLNASEHLLDQLLRVQEAGRVLARGPASAYAEFLDSLFLYYRESARAAESKTKEG